MHAQATKTSLPSIWNFSGMVAQSARGSRVQLAYSSAIDTDPRTGLRQWQRGNSPLEFTGGSGLSSS